ncbi:MAG TPA: hypothetical protein VM347_33730 [Nonomuraea sp.]|nr:hypothetical protein [Nonomuraea sp.]
MATTRNGDRCTWRSARAPPPPPSPSPSRKAGRTALFTDRAYGLPFAVQAIGRGTHVPCDGGILFETSAMATVIVDSDRRVARWGRALCGAT